MRNTLLVLFATCAFALVGFAQSTTPQSDSATTTSTTKSTETSKTHTKTMTDASFAREAAQGGVAEVDLGKLAAQKASNDDVKKFGQKMVDDHSKANAELKTAAETAGINDLPTDMSPRDKAFETKLEGLSGAAFDRAYMGHMVHDHQMDVREFQHEANNGKDNSLKQFASQTVPTLEDHLKDARDTAQKVGANTAMHHEKKSSKNSSSPTI